MFTVVSGGEFCVITNASQCVSDGATNYGNLQRCVIRANQNLYATATYYAVETYYDYLTIYTPTVSSTGSASYRTRNNPGPQDVFMRQGDTMRWYTDGSVTFGGFTVCGSHNMHPPPPAPTPGARLLQIVDTHVFSTVWKLCTFISSRTKRSTTCALMWS